MPTLTTPDGTRLHALVKGDGPETVVFSHGYLMDHRMFDAQIAALASRYRVVAYDHRGHGRSAPSHGPFDLYTLVDDAVAVIEALADGGPVHFVGMSTGGYVAQRLALRRPDLVRSMVLIDTAGRAERPEARRQYDLLLWALRWLGFWAVLGRALPILMGERFRTDPARRAERDRWRARILALDRRSIVAFGHAIFDRDDVLDALRDLDVPSLVVVGAEDHPTPVAEAQALAEALSARLEIVPDAGHTSPVEAPDAVTEALTGFLRSL